MDGPTAIRYPRGAEDKAVLARFYIGDVDDAAGLRRDFSVGDTLDAVLVTHGRMVSEAMRAQMLLTEKGKHVGILLAEFIKPYDKMAALVREALTGIDCPVVTLEEEIRAGGFGMLLTDKLSTFPEFAARKFAIVALDDNFAEQKTDECIYKTACVSAEDVVLAVERLIKQE